MTATRITQRTVSDTALRGLQSSLSRVQQFQQELSSGKRVSKPSDDPSAAAAAMNFRSQRAANVQYLRNADTATARLNVTDNALTQFSDRLRSVRELMVGSQNGALGLDARAALGVQVTAIKAEVVDLYNTRYLDRPVFAGTAAGSDAVDATTGAYLGNDVPVVVRISRDATLRTDVKGTDVAADTAPAMLDRIATDVTTMAGASGTDFAELDATISKVLQSLGDVGARSARLDSTKSMVDSQRLDLTSQISESEDVDLPEAIMNLQSQQVAYQSALGAAAKITQTSLIDYLK